MHQVLKQSTAATTVVGPVLDSTGAAYTGAVIADLNLTKNGTTAAMAAAATLTHDHNGHYILVFTTTNTDTLGRLDVTVNKATYAMPPGRFEVLAAAAFDTLVTNGTLASTTSGRTIVTDAAGLVDANAVKLGPTGAGTAQTARDIGASVLLSSGTGTGQLDFTSGVTKANVTQLLGTAWLTPGTAGTPDVNTKLWNGLTTVALPLVPTTAGRTLDVSVGGEAGLDWANVGSPTTVLGLTNTTVGVVTLVTTATTLTNLPSITAGWLTATGIAADAITAAKIADGAIDAATFAAGAINAAAIAADAITDAKVASDVTIASVTGAVGSVTGAVGSVTGNVGGNVTGSVGSISGVTFPSNFSVLSISASTGLVDVTQTAADKVWSTAARTITGGTIGTYTGNTVQTGDAYARLGAPAGASVSADVAAVKTDTAQIAADLPGRITKNVALSSFMFFMVLTSDHVTGATGKTVTATRSLDGAAFASCANAVTEVSSGWYKIDLAAADLNANVVALRFAATACDDRMMTIVTQPT